MIQKLRCLPLLLSIVFFPCNLFAHRLDENLQATLVEIEPKSIRLRINITPGAAIAEQTLAILDRNHDGVVVTNEVEAYAELLKRDLSVRLDERLLELKAVEAESSASAELRTGFGMIQIAFSLSPGSLARGAHRLSVENRHLAATSAYLFNAAQPRSSFIQITAQNRNESQSTGTIDFNYHPAKQSIFTFGAFGAAAALVIAVSIGVWRAGEARSSRLRSK